MAHNQPSAAGSSHSPVNIVNAHDHTTISHTPELANYTTITQSHSTVHDAHAAAVPAATGHGSGGNGSATTTAPPVTTTPRNFSEAIEAIITNNLPIVQLSNETVLYGILVVMLAQACVILLFDAYGILFFTSRAARQRQWYHHTSVRQMLLGYFITALSSVVAVVFDVCRIIAVADYHYGDELPDFCYNRTNNNNITTTVHNIQNNYEIMNLSQAASEAFAESCGLNFIPAFPGWFFKTLFYIIRCCQLALLTLIVCCAYHKYQLLLYSPYGRRSDRTQVVMQALVGGTAKPTSYDNERVFSRRNRTLKQIFPAVYAIVVGVLVAIIIFIESNALAIGHELDYLWPFLVTTPYPYVDADIYAAHKPPQLAFVWYLYTALFYIMPLLLAFIVDRLLYSHQIYAEIRLQEILLAPPQPPPAVTGEAAKAPPKKGERPEDKLRDHIYDVGSVKRQHMAAFMLAWVVPAIHDTFNHWQQADQRLETVADAEWAWYDELPNLVLLCFSQYMFLCFAIFSLQFVHGLPVDIAANKKTQ